VTCLRRGQGNCVGPVSERPSFSGSGLMIAECEHHMDESYEKEEKLREVYPDSPMAPAWFDPTAAGERWDDDY
jgi:hypothetical protein